MNALGAVVDSGGLPGVRPGGDGKSGAESMSPKETIPGVIGPVANDRGWRKGRGGKSIEAKRESVIRGIERSLRGEKGAPRLEQFDPVEGVPVIRVLYASHALPIFDGEISAAIDPGCDRAELWRAIIEQIRSGAFDAPIEAVAARVYRSIGRKRQGLPRAA